jgi:hypothetical protein
VASGLSPKQLTNAGEVFGAHCIEQYCRWIGLQTGIENAR